MIKVVFYCLAIIAVLLAGVFGVAGERALLSFMFGGLAVILPQAAMLSTVRRSRVESAFSLWASKFFVAILLLVISARFLQVSGLMAVEYFVGGVVLAIVCNIALLAQMARAN